MVRFCNFDYIFATFLSWQEIKSHQHSFFFPSKYWNFDVNKNDSQLRMDLTTQNLTFLRYMNILKEIINCFDKYIEFSKDDSQHLKTLCHAMLWWLVVSTSTRWKTSWRGWKEKIKLEIIWDLDIRRRSLYFSLRNIQWRSTVKTTDTHCPPLW